MRIRLFFSLAVCMTLVGASLQTVAADDALEPIQQRFAQADVEETPSFQKHVVPLLGRLGCNGRACHGSFQGQGGFRLSLFGYDFTQDHDALFEEDSPRVDRENPLESLIIAKPTDEDLHEGGMRYEKDSWQYNVIRRWIEGGAEFEKNQVQILTELKIVPHELLLSKTGEEVQVKAIAIWEDGSQEDVTPLCRFQSNDDQVATIDQNGLVTATNRGDTHLVISYDKAVVPVPVIRPMTDLVGDKYPQVAAKTKVDELVIEKLRKLGVVPSETCTDAEFLRRVRLDLTGTLPTAIEVEAFLADKSSDKRSKKVDQLLETSAYSAWWTTKLCDFTGNNPQNLNNVTSLGSNRYPPSQDWYDWIFARVAKNVAQVEKRQGLLSDLDATFRAVEADSQLLEGLDRFSEQAHSIITSKTSRDAFDISKESPAFAKPFGEDAFGASCLLATRLVESGVRFITLQLGGWDTHQDNWTRLSKGTGRNPGLLPQLDTGLSALLNGLEQKGLLESTAIFVTGEFGRTPKINSRSAEGGRDHYPRCMFMLQAGGSVRGGQVLGESDENASMPANEGFTPDDVAASFYHNVGIDHTKEYQTSTGRPIMIVRDGSVIKDLFA